MTQALTHIVKAGFAAMTVVLVLGLAGCGRSEPGNQAPASSQTSTAAPAPAGSVEITLKTDPNPVKMGDNALEVVVMQDGKPVTDATVTAELFMAAMPATKVPEMRMLTDLTSAGGGTYRGTGQVMMAGSWEVTVVAMRNGQELANRKFTVATR